MSFISRVLSVIAAGCILLGAAGSEGAQPVSPYRQYGGNAFANGHFKSFFQRQWRASSSRSQGSPAGSGERQASGSAGGEAPTLSPGLLPLSVSSFRTVGNPVVPRRLAAGVPELDAAQCQALEGALLELLKGYEQLLDQHDEQRLKNNLAGAFNHLFLSAYYALKGGQELSAEQQESMLEQLNAGIALGLKERRMSDKDKQELYESVVLSGSIILGLYNEGRDPGHPEQLKAARDLARELLEQSLGLTLDKVRLEGGAVRVD
ncbi:MAG: DUF6683 family protein [Archangium sp.]